MKLSRRILTYFSISITIVFLITVISTSLAFRSSLNSYLISNIKQEFNDLSKELADLYSTNPNLDSRDLANYANNRSVNIQIYNNDSDLVAEFDGIPETKEKSSLVSENYRLVSQSGRLLGTMKLSYMEDLSLYNESAALFYKNMNRSYAITIVVSILLLYFLILYFSKKIEKPIADISEFTNRLKEGQYLEIEDKYNIFELDELANNLNFLSSALRDQEEYMLNYAQDISHELRTPLTNLQLHLEGIKDNIIEADEDTIDLLLDEIKRLNKMVDRLNISFSKSPKLDQYNFDYIEVVKLIKQAIGGFKPKFDQKEITVNLSGLNELIMRVDKDKFTQVINNLISNAIKAVDRRGHIEIVVNSYKNRNVIIIKDDGVGIGKEDIDHIFKRFYRVDSARNRENGGHGLGLTLVNNYVANMNGKILVNSKLGQGSEFILTFHK